MPSFQRIPGKFDYRGMCVSAPPDRQPENRCPFIFNKRWDNQKGGLFTRPAIAQLATTSTGLPVHSLVRMNDSVPEATQPYARFAGIGNGIWYGQSGALTALDSGYSGNPLSFVTYRPAQSPESALYTYDSLKQQSYKTDGTKRNIGIAAPAAEPLSTPAQPLYKIIDATHTTGNWYPGSPVGGSPPPATLDNRVDPGTSALAILYDSGSTGMASIVPFNSVPPAGDYSWMLAASMVTIDSEDVVIEQVFPSGYSTVIGAVHYDSGSTGLCTIAPLAALPGLARNMVLLIAGSTYVRILSVTAGPDGSYSFRCGTGSTTVSSGQSLVAPPSFRAWTTATHAASAPITGSLIYFKLIPTITGGQMQALLFTNPNTGVAPIDLTQADGRPLTNEDYLHVSLGFVNPAVVTEVHIMLGMDSNVGVVEDGATGNFADNYYYYVMRQGDFQASITGFGGVTTEQATTQSQLDALSSQISGAGVAIGAGENVAQPPYPIPQSPSTSAPVTSQIALGSGGYAWNELLIKLNDFTRVGSNQSLNWNNIVTLGIYAFVSGGYTRMGFSGWWAGGGYGPDCNFNTYGNQAPQLQWRYRYRNSLTGAHSTVSPETRNGELLRRQADILTAPASPDPQVDYIDWERRGGTNPDWHYVGSQPASAGTFMDTTTEAAAQIADPLEVASYQPWPVTDVPHTGTALVVGTSMIWQSGDQFNMRWLRGTEVIIGGNTYSLYAPPSSPTTLQLAESVVPPSGVFAFSIPEATIEGNPLYAAWLDEANNRVLACGDPLNPGLLYFSNNDNPDGASDAGYIEVTSPSEPLLNGFYNEGSNYVFSNTSLYRVESTPGAVNPYASYRLSGVEGMAGPWAFDCQRKLLFYWGPDGIYAYMFGPAAESLTAQDLYPLFPHAGQQGQGGIPGVAVSIAGFALYPPSYGAVNFMRVAYSENFVYATYQNSNGDIESLVYSLASKGWFKDNYAPQVTQFVLEKGVPNPLLMSAGFDGNLYAVASGSGDDAGGPVMWLVITPSVDAGDSRASKQWGDLLLDYSGKFCVDVLYDNLLVQGAAGPAVIEQARTHAVFDLVPAPDMNDEPVIHYNMALALSGQCASYLYEWQPSYVMLPEVTTARVTAWSGSGGLHNKFVQGIRIHANTFGFQKNLQVQFDGYQTGPSIAVNFQGEQTQAFSFAVPFRAHMMRLAPLDDVPWELFEDSEWIYQPEPEAANYWIAQCTALGQNGYLHAREIWLAFSCTVSGALIAAIVDGVMTPLATLPDTVGPVKQYFPVPPLKGRYWQLTASGTGLQLYERDIEFLVKSWGSSGPYSRVRPFGDASGGGGASGALI